MKVIITILAALTISFSTATANSNPEAIITTEAVSVVNIDAADIFISSSFDMESENLVFETATEMSIVQIINSNGVIEFQLPVMANKVMINKNLFGEGTYKLGFLMEGQTQANFTEVTIK